LGIDIKEKKMTLPLIYSLSKVSWLEKRRIMGIVKNDRKSQKQIKEVIDFVKKNGGIEYAKEKMNAFHQEALTLLRDFSDSSYKSSLIELVQFTIDRKI
jgi:octaprenyl-diphosphate synthase